MHSCAITGAVELNSVRFSRDSVTLLSYEADVVRVGLETWADMIAALA